jgi:hypothetical protein
MRNIEIRKSTVQLNNMTIIPYMHSFMTYSIHRVSDNFGILRNLNLKIDTFLMKGKSSAVAAVTNTYFLKLYHRTQKKLVSYI